MTGGKRPADFRSKSANRAPNDDNHHSEAQSQHVAGARYRRPPEHFAAMSATLLGHLIRLMFAMPVDQAGRRASARRYGKNFDGRTTLAEILDTSERSVTSIIAKLNGLPRTSAKIRQFADYQTRFELSYRVHRDARFQVPAQLCQINRPAARGNAAKALLYLQLSPPWERTRDEVADRAGIDRKAATQALKDLKQVGLIDANHDPELGRIRRPEAERQKAAAAHKPRGENCHLRGGKTATSRSNELSHELACVHGPLPQSAVSESQPSGKTNDQPPKKHRVCNRDIRECLKRMMQDESPFENRDSPTLLNLIGEHLATGISVDELAKRYGGNLAGVHDPYAILITRLRDDIRQKYWTQAPEPRPRPDGPPKPVGDDLLIELLESDNPCHPDYVEPASDAPKVDQELFLRRNKFRVGSVR